MQFRVTSEQHAHGDRRMRILDMLYTPVRRPQPTRCKVFKLVWNRKRGISEHDDLGGTRKRIPEIFLAGSIIRTYNGTWFAVEGRDGAHHIDYRCNSVPWRIRLLYRRLSLSWNGKQISMNITSMIQVITFEIRL